MLRYNLQAAGWTLGAEPSGHIINLNHTSCGDGLISALMILEISQRRQEKISHLRQGWQRAPSISVNIASTNPKKDAKHPSILAKVKEIDTKLGQDGLLILRPSGTEPVIRMTIQGST